MSVFAYDKMFGTASSDAQFRRLDCPPPVVCSLGGLSLLKMDLLGLEQLAYEAFRDIAFYVPSHQLQHWANMASDPNGEANERFVAASLLENAIVAAEGELPLCQDTGIAEILGWKGQDVRTPGDDGEALTRGIRRAYHDHNLRYSVLAPSDMFDETNTRCNLPAQIELLAAPGESYDFLFMAKGGGSTNKTLLSLQTKALLEPARLEEFLQAALAKLGVAACPPYNVGIVIGGLSPELTVRTAKLAAAGFYDYLPAGSDGGAAAFRSLQWEQRVMEMMAAQGLGAQFGGKHMALQARVIRLPRHAGSCPVALAVSCSAHRVCRGRITRNGVYLEQMETHPSKFAHAIGDLTTIAMPEIRLDQPMQGILAQLAHQGAGSRVRLSGPLVVARDVAHARFKQILDAGKSLPDYLKQHPIYYAGPAKTPPGKPCGSLGPTTSERMDPYMDAFMSQGACLVTLGKGARASSVPECCARYGGFYLGTIGGAAALLASKHILSSEVIDFADLGMEAVHRIVVRDLPAFVIYDNRGQSLYLV